MAPRRAWADLPPELLLCVTDRLTALRCYLAARGVCAAWRSALAPAAPYLLFGHRPAVVVSLPLDRVFHLLATLGSVSGRCIGSNNGWLAVTTKLNRNTPDVLLVNPFTGQEVDMPFLPHVNTRDSFFLLSPLPPWRDPWPVFDSKVVFAPNPREDDFTVVVAALGGRTLACISAGKAAAWSVEEVAGNAELADVAYHNDGGKFYCLATNGDVHGVHVRRGGGRTKRMLEPLLSRNAEDVFAAPYSRLSDRVGAKYLAFCEGDMYQIWRNTGPAFDLPVPGGGEFHVSENEVFVFRYDAAAPARRPCWEAAADLGGHSVFVGLNNAVSVRTEAVPGLKGDCVYWMCQNADYTAMEFDLRTRRATPCVEWQKNAVCWYILGDMASRDKKSAEILQRQQKRMELGV
ncbi:hypothetical protein EJB05_20695, partial [Eragrostis curvula]